MRPPNFFVSRLIKKTAIVSSHGRLAVTQYPLISPHTTRANNRHQTMVPFSTTYIEQVFKLQRQEAGFNILALIK